MTEKLSNQKLLSIESTARSLVKTSQTEPDVALDLLRQILIQHEKRIILLTNLRL